MAYFIFFNLLNRTVHFILVCGLNPPLGYFSIARFRLTCDVFLMDLPLTWENPTAIRVFFSVWKVSQAGKRTIIWSD